MNDLSVATERVSIDCAGRNAVLEVQRIGWRMPSAPLVVFLHEGLGSVSMWRDFPRLLCSRIGCRGLVYSRPGYGASTPRPPQARWQPDFMHRQAWEVLPALYRALQFDPTADPPVLLGHSDGASIALLHAARHPTSVSGLVLLAPHILVEEITLAGVVQARSQYLHGDLRSRLSRHHVDPDSAFWGWNDAWLDPRFRAWTIVQEIASIRCPVVAIQGHEDAYGTMAQISGIADRLPQARLMALTACGHSPHRDHPEVVIEATAAMLGAATSGVAPKEKPPI